MYIDKALCAKMEGCFKQTHNAVVKDYPQGRVLDINGGAACFSEVDSFFSQVVGWGFSTAPKHFKKELDTIEGFYRALGHTRVDIELCPFVGNPLVCFLSQRGYRVSELSNVSYLDLTAPVPVSHDPKDGFLIQAIKSSELKAWSHTVAQGFGFPEAQEQFMHYASAEGITAFAVYDADKMIAGATLALHGDVCDLAVASTLPAYRNKGIQKKLLHKRIDLARQSGISLAIVTTEPGSVSDSNIQKTGFRPAYTRIKMTLEF